MFRRRSWPVLVLWSLPTMVAAGQSPAKLLPAPWADGEALWFVTTSQPAATPRPTPMPEATAVQSSIRPPGGRVDVVESTPHGSWMLRTFVLRPGWSATVGSLEVRHFSSLARVMEVDRETLAPAASASASGAGDGTARSGPARADIAVSDAALGQIVADARLELTPLRFLLRRLPLADGYSADLGPFGARSGAESIKVEVVGRETVTVPAGTFDCFKLQVTDGSPQPRLRWISTDGHRYLVKESDGRSDSALVRIARWREATPVTFRRESWNVSFTAPQGWVAHTQPGPLPTLFNAIALSADGEAQCTFRLRDFLLFLKERPREAPVGWRPEKPRVSAEREIAQRRRFFSEYAVRPESWTGADVDGFPTVRFAADFVPRGATTPIVEYTSHANQPLRAAVSCLVQPEAFEKRKPEIDALLDSLRLR